MSEIKVNSIKGVGASLAAITVNNTDGSCTANITNKPNRNLIINGAMQVAQRGTSSTTSGYGSVDRFKVLYNGTDEAPTHAQVDLTSSDTPFTLGFRKAFKITNGNQTSGAGASDFIAPQQHIEGQNISSSGWNVTDPNSKLTISYWVRSSVAQTFFGRFRAFASSQYEYAYSFALSANTWTKVTTTIPGNSNFSSLVNTNAVGLFHIWQCFFGTDFTNNKTLNQWAAKDNANKSPDMTSTWYTTNDATFEITGVQLEVGSVATDFEHRSFGQELALCQRYFQTVSRSSNANSVNGTFAAGTCNNNAGNGGIIAAMVRFQTTMRAVPTMTQSGTFSHHVSGVNVADCSLAFSQAYIDGVKCAGTQTTFVSANGSCGELTSKYSDTSTATISASAEL